MNGLLSMVCVSQMAHILSLKANLHKAVDFFNHLNMLYGTVTEFCTPQEVRLLSCYDVLGLNGSRQKVSHHVCGAEVSLKGGNTYQGLNAFVDTNTSGKTGSNTRDRLSFLRLTTSTPS